MKKLIFSIIFFLFIGLVSWGIVHAVPNPYHPANPTTYSGVSNVSPPVMTGTMGGNSVYTVSTQNGLCYFLDQTRMLISGQTSFHNRGFGIATYLNASVTRTWYNRITDRLEIAQENDISFHSLAGRDYSDHSAACTSYLLDSERFAEVTWDKLQAGITLYGTDPMGGEKAMFLREDNADNPHAVRQTIAKEVFADNAIVTFSFFIKADSRTWVLARMSRKNTLVCGTYFDVANGIIGSTAAGGVSNVQISEQPINGSYRVSVTGSIAAGANDPTFGVYLCTGDTVASYQGDANSGLTIWGAQVTQTSWLAPYFATEASAVIYPTSFGQPNFVVPQDIFAETLGGELHVTANAASDPFGNEAGVTTGWTPEGFGSGNSFWASDTIKNVGTHSLAANSNISKVNGNRIHKDIGTDFGLVEDNLYELTFDFRHHGAGGIWHIGLDDDATGGTYTLLIKSLDNTETTFTSYSRYFVYNADYRYLVARERSATNDGGIYLDNLSCSQVTNARISTIADGLMSPHGTFMFYATPLFDADDMTSWCGLFNFDGETGTTGFYISSSGRYALGDGTNVAYGHASSGVSAWETSKVVGQWRVNSNVSQMRIGVDRGDGNSLVWGPWTTYDGAFPEVLFSVFEEGWGRVLLQGPWIWNRILTDTEINWMGGSP